jgi:hypothetical protein
MFLTIALKFQTLVDEMFAPRLVGCVIRAQTARHNVSFLHQQFQIFIVYIDQVYGPTDMISHPWAEVCGLLDKSSGGAL